LSKPIQHTRITQLPVPESICGGQLDSFQIVQRGKSQDLLLDYQALDPARHTELLEQDGRLFERSRGHYLPRRLRFFGIEGVKIQCLYQDPGTLAPDHPARILVDLYHWVSAGESLPFFLLFGRSSEDAEIRFFARRVEQVERIGTSALFDLHRDWSPAPPMPPGLVPQPRALHRRFGGDPVTVQVNGRETHRRLFVGGVDIQPVRRPAVDAVLNLGEHPSAWSGGKPLPQSDHWENIGEGSQGMSLTVLQHQAAWVIERLQNGQRVLVHCAAGMNRSVTVCCAVLIMLEEISAGQALTRVRQHHPWARPDGQHWLTLKWLASTRMPARELPPGDHP
jgi:hypothetical protein